MRPQLLDPARYRDLPLRFEPTEDQRRCLTVLCYWQAPHNVRHYVSARGIEPITNDGLKLAIRGELATYDLGHLTTLVAGCHQWRVRMSLSGRSNGLLEIMMHARQPSGNSYERHPSPAAALNGWADAYPPKP